MKKSMTRRKMMQVFGASLGALALAACQPKIVEVERIVKETIEVEKVVEKEVVVKEAVEVAKEVTRVVEKVVQAPQPTREPMSLIAWSLGLMNPDSVAWKPYQDSVYEIMEDKLPGVTLKFQDMGWEETLRQNMVTGLLGGTAPDIIVGESSIREYARMGVYLPLDDPLAEAGIKDNLIPATYLNALADGKIYGISTGTAVFAFVSNNKVVEQAGLDPSEWPWTWSQLLERSAAITKAGNNEFFGLSILGPVGYAVGGAMRYAVLARTAGAYMCQNDCEQPYFDDPKLESVLAYLRELAEYTPPGLLWNPTQGQVDQQVYMGKCAYAWAPNQHYGHAIAHKVEDSVQYEAVPIPDEGGQNATNTVANTLVLVMSATRHPHEAVEFVKILTMDEVTDHFYLCSNGRSPATYSGLARTLPNILPVHKVHFELLQGKRDADIGMLPQFPVYDKVWGAFNEMMTKVFTTKERIPPLQAEAQAAAEKAIAEKP
jgi:ABC-type glycerol-3-phosphate transport system substrate-binding protein